MRDIRQILDDDDLASFARVQLNSYPAISASFEEVVEQLKLIRDKDENSGWWGLWEDGALIAGIRYLDFVMNYYGSFIAAGGAGALAVDLVHKKKGAARELIEFFLRYCQEREQSVAILYPFRPDFYYRMGFGYGTKMHQYRFEPASLPRYPRHDGVRYLTADDAEAITECHDAYAAAHHGLCRISRFEVQGMVRTLAPRQRMVGYFEVGQLMGYITFGFERASDQNFIRNNMLIRQWISLNGDAFEALSGFLRTQLDQVERIVFNTQDDEFHHLLFDVRNGSGNMIPSVYHESNTSGVGVMYRVMLPDFLQHVGVRQFGDVDETLVFEVEDTFWSSDHPHRFVFRDGRFAEGDASDGLRVRMNIADLSALLMGSVRFDTLHRFGKVDVPSEAVPSLNRIFRTTERPHFLTVF